MRSFPLWWVAFAQTDLFGSPFHVKHRFTSFQLQDGLLRDKPKAPAWSIVVFMLFGLIDKQCFSAMKEPLASRPVSAWLLCHLAFLFILPTFLIFCIMSNMSSHAQRTPTDMFLRSDWYSCYFFVFRFEWNPYKCLSSVICVLRDTESHSRALHNVSRDPRQILSLDVRVNRCQLQ